MAAGEAVLRAREAELAPRWAGREADADGFKNSVRGRMAELQTGRGGIGGKLKKRGPLGFLILAIVGGGAMFLGGQSLLGPHLSALFTEATDVQFTSYSLRNQRLFKFMIDGGDQIAVTPFSRKFTTFTPYMKGRLERNGIEVGHLDADGNFQSGDLLAGRRRVLRYNGETINATDFQAKFANDVGFRDAYYKAKRGRVAGFFDDASEAFFAKRGQTRNIFDDFRSTGDGEADENEFLRTLATRLQGADGEVNTARTDINDNNTPNNPNDDVLEVTPNDTAILTADIPGDTPQIKAQTLVNDTIDRVSKAGGITGVSNIACTALRVSNMVSTMASATKALQLANLFMGVMEPISKSMAGEGSTSAINEVLNKLARPSASTVEYLDGGVSQTRSVSGSALDAGGMKFILGGAIPSRAEMMPYSTDNINETTEKQSGVLASTCPGAQAADAVISLATSSIPGGALAKFLLGMVAQTVVGAGIGVAVSAILSAVIPAIARTMFADLSGVVGVELGNNLVEGGAIEGGDLGQSQSGLMPGSADYVAAHNQETVAVLAEEAELDRLERSPFDTSSKNTFLGSIVANLWPVTTGMGGTALAPILTLGQSVGRAMGRILPTASAAGQSTIYSGVTYPCRNMEDARCDIFGNPVRMADYSLVDVTPDDPQYQAVVMPNLTIAEDEEWTIKPDSELAKFITLCGGRESPWGVLDANIASALQTDFGAILGNMPFIGDIGDLINALEDANPENQEWAKGTICRISKDNPKWESEFRYYQQFMIDMRILDQMGAFEGSQSPVLAYQENYLRKHPVDNSPAGVLARMTGMTKGDVAFVVEYLDYSRVVAEYKPEERLAFGEATVLVSSESGAGAGVSSHAAAGSSLQLSSQFAKSPRSSNTVDSNTPIISQHIIYGDIRNRSFAI